MLRTNFCLLTVIMVLAVLFTTSCANKKNFVYFQPDSLQVEVLAINKLIKLQEGDILAISVTADDVRAAQVFNQVSAYQGVGMTMQSNNPFIPTYSIDDKGNIDFPKLGKVKLAGMTRPEAIEYLRSQVSQFIVNPGISIEIRNFRITVLGEVKNPGTFPINNDRVSLLEALGMAGDLTINGVRRNVLVVREQDGIRKEYRVDLTTAEALHSPVYYLAQNDVVYVEPNGAKIQSSKYTQNASIFVSIAGVIITVISVLTRK